MKGKNLIIGFLALIVLVFAVYAVLRTVPVNNCGENGDRTGLY